MPTAIDNGQAIVLGSRGAVGGLRTSADTTLAR